MADECGQVEGEACAEKPGVGRMRCEGVVAEGAACEGVCGGGEGFR